MTDNNYTITPPDELVQQWVSLACELEGFETWQDLATQAAQWGYEQRGASNEAELQKARDEELEACCEHLQRSMSPKATIDYLRAARRPKPKPPSLKDQIITAIFRDDKSLALKLLNQALPE